MVRVAQAFAGQARLAGFEINVVVTPAKNFRDEAWLSRQS